MIITQILKRRGMLNEVRFDDGTYILIDRKLCEESALKVGDTLDDETAEKLEDTSDAIRCKSRAIYYLSGGDFSVKGMKKKLFTAGFADPFVTETIERLKELGLLDDYKFCERFIERCVAQNMSDREIKEKAYLKGIPNDVLKEVFDSQSVICESQRIKELLSGKYAKKISDTADAERVIAALMRKGFNFGDIKTALKELGEEI